MTDELVTALRSNALWATTHDAADRIEQLTAERDSAMAMQNVAYAAGYYQAECGLPEHDNAVAALAELKAAEAERDRLRGAIDGVLWMAEEWYLYGGDETTFAPDCKQAIEAARAALKGETP